MKLTFCGDTHGKPFPNLPRRRVYHVGDLGLYEGSSIKIPHVLNFIHGNHDNPQLCSKYKDNYLGRYGHLSLGKNFSMFFVSGAESTNKNYSRDYYPDEELSTLEMSLALEKYDLVRPKIMLTHCAPTSVVSEMGLEVFHSNTCLLFDEMLKIYKPKLWVYGHYHVSWEKEISSTNFKALGINELYNYEI